MTPFSATDAERQAADSASNYLARALCIVAERCNRTAMLQRDQGAIVREFPELVAALVEAQSREYLAWVLYSRLGEIACPAEAAAHELSAWISRDCTEPARGRE